MINVSKLTDIELNRAMVWLYPPEGVIRQSEWKGDPYACHTELGIIYVKNFNYLTLWQYTMPLIESADMMVNFGVKRTLVVSGVNFDSRHKNPLRAICEVLVMIKLEQE